MYIYIYIHIHNVYMYTYIYIYIHISMTVLPPPRALRSIAFSFSLGVTRRLCRNHIICSLRRPFRQRDSYM